MIRGLLAALAVVAFALMLIGPAALADDTTDGFVIHWRGVGDQIAVCPAGDSLHWANVPGQEYASGVPAEKVQCYRPDGTADPTPPWEGEGVTEGSDNRLFPPESAIGQAPWIADLADLGRVQGVPTPQDVVSGAIDGWIGGAASDMDTGLSGFFGTLAAMPLLLDVPLVRRGFAVSFALALLLALAKLAVDLHRWSHGDPAADRPDWRTWALLGAVMFVGPVGMDAVSIVTNHAVDGLWRAVLHTPAAPSGLRLMQVVTGGTGAGLFPPIGAALSALGGILFLLLSALLLFVLGLLLETCVLVWLAIGAFAPLLALWGTWSGGLSSPQLRRVGVAVARTFAFHTLLAVYWLFMYAASAGVDEALGLGGRYTVLLLVGLAMVLGLFFWVVPVLRTLVAESDEWEQWAMHAERLLLRIGAGTGDVRWGQRGAALRQGVHGGVDRAKALLNPQVDLSALPHVRGEALLRRYERAASDPGSLVRWAPYTAPGGERYLVLAGRPGAVALAEREFVSNAPLATVRVEGRTAVPVAMREAAATALAAAMEDVTVYWDSPLGPVTLREGGLVKIGEVPPRAVSMGRWGD